MKIINYELVTGADVNIFVANVLHYLKRGWQPFGNIFTHHDNIVQPMVEYIDNTRNIQHTINLI